MSLLKISLQPRVPRLLARHFASTSTSSTSSPSPATSTSSPARTKKAKRELVVNSKWGERSSDPRYSHLVYSSEVDVMLTAR